MASSPQRFIAVDRYPSDADCHEIVPRIFLGNMMMAGSYPLLKHVGITHIINCAMEIPNYHQSKDIVYKHFSMDDTPLQNISQNFEDAYKFIEDALAKGGNVFINCAAGVSRSSTILISYLMRKYKISPDEAIEKVRKIRNIVNPNPGFRKQLNDYWNNVLHAGLKV